MFSNFINNKFDSLKYLVRSTDYAICDEFKNLKGIQFQYKNFREVTFKVLRSNCFDSIVSIRLISLYVNKKNYKPRNKILGLSLSTKWIKFTRNYKISNSIAYNNTIGTVCLITKDFTTFDWGFLTYFYQLLQYPL